MIPRRLRWTGRPSPAVAGRVREAAGGPSPPGGLVRPRRLACMRTDPDRSAAWRDSPKSCAHASAAGAPKNTEAVPARGHSRGGFGPPDPHLGGSARPFPRRRAGGHPLRQYAHRFLGFPYLAAAGSGLKSYTHPVPAAQLAKGVAPIAGNRNSRTLRGRPVVTEAVARYTRRNRLPDEQGRRLPLRHGSAMNGNAADCRWRSPTRPAAWPTPPRARISPSVI